MSSTRIASAFIRIDWERHKECAKGLSEISEPRSRIDVLNENSSILEHTTHRVKN